MHGHAAVQNFWKHNALKSSGYSSIYVQKFPQTNGPLVRVYTQLPPRPDCAMTCFMKSQQRGTPLHSPEVRAVLRGVAPL